MNPFHADRFQAFLFDMDGVITDSMPHHCEAWQQVFAKFHVTVSRAEILRREGERGIVTLRTLLSENGVSPPARELEDALAEKEEIFRALPTPDLFPGVEALLQELFRRGKKLALVTGTSRAEAQSYLPPDLFACFHTVVSGDLVCFGKPDPEPYLRAVNALRLLPRECLVIENAPFGIESAREAGLACVAVATSLPAEHLQDADRIVGSLEELRALLLPAGTGPGGTDRAS